MKLTNMIIGKRFRSEMVVAFLALAIPTATNATFIVDTSPGGDALNLNDAKDVNSFSGVVDGNTVNITSVQNVDVSSGNATIKPVSGTTLSSLTFTPASPNLFSDFSFRGQLDSPGDVTLTVQDNQGNAPQTFTFTIANANQDFSRMGITSTDGETIKWVEISNASFKEQKLDEFSFATVPEPTTMIAGALLLLPFGASTLRVLRKNRAA